MTNYTPEEIEALRDQMKVGLYMIPQHMRTGVSEYVKRGRDVGGFLSALLSGDWVHAQRVADPQNAAAIAGNDWQRFIVECLPPDCHGSKEKFEAWKARGGLKGKTTS